MFITRLLAGFFFIISIFVGHANAQSEHVAWLEYHDGSYYPVERSTANTAYLKIDPRSFPGGKLLLRSARPYFIFVNGKLSGEFDGQKALKLDSLSALQSSGNLLIAVHQPGLDIREMHARIESAIGKHDAWDPGTRPSVAFRDFVVFSGLIIIIAFLFVTRLNPKLASDYLSPDRIFSVREADDAQSNARLTSSNNFQFYIVCGLLLAFYLMLIAHHLPIDYKLPLYLASTTFWGLFGEWIKLSLVIVLIFLGKIVIVFALTRLFGMKGLARVHFFNWMRLLLLVIGAATIVVFAYDTMRGQSEAFFEFFLALIVVTLVGWIFLVFMKLNGKTEHSMFHLFSYICATEIIPLMITIKVLFQ